jgi:hypothetical protein
MRYDGPRTVNGVSQCLIADGPSQLNRKFISEYILTVLTLGTVASERGMLAHWWIAKASTLGTCESTSRDHLHYQNPYCPAEACTRNAGPLPEPYFQ